MKPTEEGFIVEESRKMRDILGPKNIEEKL